MTITLQPISVATGSQDEDGRLVLLDGKLVAVLVHLVDEVHETMRGAWYVEAGFGPCAASTARSFASLEEAERWAGREVAH
jgi:hypothetical protein